MMHYDVVKSYIEENRKPLGIIQSAFVNSVASLIYSEYIRLFKKVDKPVERVMVPSIHNVEMFLTDSPFISKLKLYYIDNMKFLTKAFPFYDGYAGLDVFKLFEDDEFKLIFNEHMIPNLKKYIPSIISQKFQLDGDGGQLFKQDRDVQLFGGDISSEYSMYVGYESALWILMNDDDVEKEEINDRGKQFTLYMDEVLSITDVNAICPIYFNYRICGLEKVMDIMKFITGIKVELDDNREMYNIDIGNNEAKIVKLV